MRGIVYGLEQSGSSLVRLDVMHRSRGRLKVACGWREARDVAAAMLRHGKDKAKHDLPWVTFEEYQIVWKGR